MMMHISKNGMDMEWELPEVTQQAKGINKRRYMYEVR